MTYRYEAFADQYLDVGTSTGMNWMCMCVFHDDHNPSMSFEIDKGLFMCFTCSAKGNIISLARHLGLTVKDNGFIFELEDPEAEMTALFQDLDALDMPPVDTVVQLPEAWLTRFRTHKTNYWRTRGIMSGTRKRWQLGWDRINNHGIIPIRTADGKLLGAIRRKIDPNAESPKYLNPKGFSKKMALFGSWLMQDGDEAVVLCEGPLDAVKIDQAGFRALAVMGSGLTPEQVNLLLKMGVEEVTLFFDNDKAGFKMAMKAMGMLRRGFNVYAADYAYDAPNDPGGMSDRQIALAMKNRVDLFS